jgi:hypothetical protein
MISCRFAKRTTQQIQTKYNKGSFVALQNEPVSQYTTKVSS